MRIVNQTKNTVIAENAAVASTPLKRAKGLLGRKEFQQGTALVITHCNSIHTFFMHFAIDVIFVGQENKIVAAISDLKPGRLSPVYWKAKFVVEAPSGTIAKTSTAKGDFLSLS